ncbi:MAG: 3-dehydroquinate synthase [Clostridiaceae bacterium]|nr:3-dehydroquinate synthase [Clostridiaceae bacterium]
MKEVIVKTSGKTYPIYIESGIFNRLPDICQENYSGKKLAVVTDNNVYNIYGKTFVKKLEQKGFFVIPIIFEAGEKNKNLVTLTSIYDALAEHAFTRSDIVVALGGGVTGDMAGLAAATFLRGMGYIQIPSTLLAMVDSSIGGKVAVDLPQGKNLIGAFYQPDSVYTDPMLLETINDRCFSDGMAELLKHGFIKDISLYEKLVNNEYDRKSLSENLDEYISVSCNIKRSIVEEDEKDNGIRQLLNFGHTIGHAIERVQNFSGLSHGEAIAIGMIFITKLTESMGLTEKGEAEKIIKALKKYKLPITWPELNIADVVKAIALDKKNRSGRITLACIERIGHGRLIEIELKELEDKIYGILED